MTSASPVVASQGEAWPFVAYASTGPETCTPSGPLGAVEADAWEEIERLGSLGLPVCDAVWIFWRGEKIGNRTGVALVRHSDEDPRPAIWIDADIDHHGAPNPDGVDADHLTAAVRSTVRHEFAHALTYLLGADDLDGDAAALGALFPGALVGDPALPGLEAAAEAIAEELTPADEVRVVYYDEEISPGNAANARAMLALVDGYRG
ncbi:hypothetical protein ACFWGN_16090 [Oerskovia sp. NPDC060338]|uniref:hypothetical protein n=1 Tax=Oerskovia sp. NPDC060338 TaxID=3347100 RepID=UPI003647345F